MCAKWWLKKKKEEEEEEKEEGNNALVKSFISVLIKGLIFSRCWPVNPPPTCVARQLFFQLLFRSQRVELLLAFGHQALWTASAGYCQLSFMRLVKRDPFSSPLNRKWSEWELGNVNRLNRKALHFSIAESWLVDQRFDYAKGGGGGVYFIPLGSRTGNIAARNLHSVPPGWRWFHYLGFWINTQITEVYLGTCSDLSACGSVCVFFCCFFKRHTTHLNSNLPIGHPGTLEREKRSVRDYFGLNLSMAWEWGDSPRKTNPLIFGRCRHFVL